MKKKSLLLVASILVTGILSAMSQSNPSSTNATDVEMQLSWPDGTTYISALHDSDHSAYLGSGTTWQELGLMPDIGTPSTWDYTDQWDETGGGTAEEKLAYQSPPPYGAPYDNQYFWGASSWPEAADGYYVSLPSGNTNDAGAPIGWGVGTLALYGSLNFATSDGKTSLSVNDQAEITLLTGGEADSTDTELYAIQGGAQARTFTDQSGVYGNVSGVAPGQIQIGNLGNLSAVGTNGTVPYGVLYAVLPTHKKVLVTPSISAAGSISAGVNATPYPLLSICYASTPTDRARTTIGVCEQVLVYFPSLPTNGVWSVSGGGTLSTNFGTSTTFTAPDVASTCTISVTTPLTKSPIKKTFTVVPPAAVKFTLLGKEHTKSACEAGFHAQATLLPQSVSFYNIEISEMNCTATATGCFASFNGQVHPTWTQQGAGWLTPDQSNVLATNLVDYVDTYLAFPDGPGTISWPIPWNYRKHGATDNGHYITTLTHYSSATDTSCTTTKNGITVQFDDSDPTVSD